MSSTYVDGTTPLDAAHMNALQQKIEKAAVNGYASLDSGGKVPLGQVPTIPAASVSGLPGAEIAYDQIIANVNVTATAETSPTTVIPGSAHTFDGNPVLLEFQAPFVQTDPNGNCSIYAGLFEGTTLLARLGLLLTVANVSAYAPFRGSYRFAPSAGSHTYSIKSWSTLGGGIVGAGPGGGAQLAPAYLRIIRV